MMRGTATNAAIIRRRAAIHRTTNPTRHLSLCGYSEGRVRKTPNTNAMAPNTPPDVPAPAIEGKTRSERIADEAKEYLPNRFLCSTAKLTLATQVPRLIRTHQTRTNAARFCRTVHHTLT